MRHLKAAAAAVILAGVLGVVMPVLHAQDATYNCNWCPWCWPCWPAFPKPQGPPPTFPGDPTTVDWDIQQTFNPF